MGKKQYLLWCLLLGLSTTAWAWTQPQNKDKDAKAKAYVEAYRHIAILEMQRSGIPASIKLAQGLLESGMGESELATRARNHFGIKCGGDWDGKFHKVWDDEPQKSCFRVYASVEESYIAHTEFLLNPKKAYRYGKLFKLAPTDYKAWAKGLKRAGYATAKHYDRALIALIERYDLYRYDYLSFPVQVTDEALLRQFFEQQADSMQMPNFVIPIDPLAGANTSIEIPTQKQKVMDLSAVYVQVKDNWGTLAKRYRVRVRKLKRWNELEKLPAAGHIIYLEKKHKKYKGRRLFHTVRVPKENLEDVAHRYGIRLRQLKKLNTRLDGRTLRYGDKVLLR